MNILAMDTAQGASSVALWRDGKVLARRFELMRTGHAERLVPQVLEVMGEAGMEMADLDRLACTIGPGTFSGTRIALAAARGMALALSIPVIGVTTLEAVAAGLAPGSGKLRVGAFDARRGELYVQAFEGESLSPIGKPQVLTLAAAACQIGGVGQDRVIEVAGTGAGLLLEALAAIGIKAVAPEVEGHPDAALIADIAAARAADATPPEPLYLRAPDAKLPDSK